MAESWKKLTEPHERVAWARKRAGFETVRAAAEALAVRENTYAAFEREPGMSKASALSYQRAQEFGRKFKVSWIWLLSGEGTPTDHVMTGPQSKVIAVMSDETPEEQERIARVVEEMARKAG